MRTMVICVATLGGGGLIHYVAVSLPLVPCLLDGVKYMDPADMKPPQDQPDSPPKTSRSGAQKRGFERTARAPRAPTLRSLVKLALKCDSAEQMGEQLKKRFEARQRYRGIDPGKGRERRAEAELERLLGQD